jgi:hypothetical protein
MDLREIGWGRWVEWLQLAQDKDQCQALVNVVMDIWVLVLCSFLIFTLHQNHLLLFVKQCVTWRGNTI